MFDDYHEGLRELKRGYARTYSYYNDCDRYSSYDSNTGEYYDGCTTTKGEWIFIGIAVGGVVLLSAIFWFIRKCRNRRI